VLVACGASATRRENGTVRLSYDEGQTSPVRCTGHAGPFAYSCLAALADGTVDLLYERDGYTTITLARFDLAWLTNGKDRL
jgi:sialidase-1